MMTKLRIPVRTLGVILALSLVFSILLGLDLAFRGLAWTLFWNFTGEEEPFAQIRAMIELPGTLTRLPPRTESMAVINHAGVNPYGINTFLQTEVEPAKRERQMAMIAEAGFRWIRQEFPWEDIEIHARGDFEDRRNVDAIGVVDAWAKYDHIVDLAQQYGITIQARLSNPPAWSHADPAIGTFAPPDDLQDYVNFAVAVAERYHGRLRYFQVWNEPNIYPEWGERPVSPEGYTEMLCRTYDALKAVDPEIVVINAALSPTVSLTDRNMSDLVFLQRMYDAGAARCFDVLSVQGYGFYSGPTDQRMRTTTLTYARHLYLRDMMVANGDAEKAVWISEAAWNPVPPPEVVPDIVGRLNFGQVTDEQAARYLPLAYQRAQEEWPWIGVINYWFFKRADESERNQAFYYFRMVEPDFSPMPVYGAIQEYIADQTPTLYIGTHQEDHWAITYPDDREIVDAAGAQLGKAVRTTEAAFTASGTEVIVRWFGYAALRIRTETGRNVEIGLPPGAGQVAEPSGEADWHTAVIHQSTLAETHTYQIDSPYDGMIIYLDSVVVLNRTRENVLPVVAVGMVLTGLVCVFGIRALLARRLRSL